jgi:hypothetical protein
MYHIRGGIVVTELMAFHNKACECNATLYVKESFFNPFFITVNGKEYELNDICFYNSEGVLYRIGRGWFSSRNNTNNAYEGITLASEPILRRKEKFDGKVFIMKAPTIPYQIEKCVVLYLPIAYLESLNYEVKTKTDIYDYREITQTLVVTQYFDIVIDNKGKFLFNKWKRDLLDRVEAAETRDAVNKVIDIMRYK